MKEIELIPDSSEDVDMQMKFLMDSPGKMMYSDWVKKMRAEDELSMQRILATKQGREAYERQFHTTLDTSQEALAGLQEIPMEVFAGFNQFEGYDEDTGMKKVDMGNMSDIFAKV